MSFSLNRLETFQSAKTFRCQNLNQNTKEGIYFIFNDSIKPIPQAFYFKLDLRGTQVSSVEIQSRDLILKL